MYRIQKFKRSFSIFTAFCMLVSLVQLATPQMVSAATDPYLLSLNRTTYGSSSNGESTTDKAVDNDSNSRWESEWGKDDEWLYVDLGASASITEVKINWENAYAKDYVIEVSDDETEWHPIHTVTNGTGGNEDLSVTGTGRYVRLHFSKRAQVAYGYSIFDFQVYGTGGINTPPATPLGENIALNKTATASSVHEDWYLKPGQVDAKNAVDGDMNTHWGSAVSDSQWIYVDLESSHTIGRVILNWDSSARSYDIEVSDDAQTWKKVYTQLNGRGGEENIPLYATGRYIRMNGITRSTTYEFGLKEFKVYDYVSNDPKPVYTTPDLPSAKVTHLGSGSYVSDTTLFPQPMEPFEKTSEVNSPIPSNDWWQSLLIKNLGDALITLPLKAKYQKQGLGMLTPSAGWVQDRSAVTEKNIDLFLMANNINTSVMNSKVSGYGDYSANVVLSDDDTEKMKTTFVKGSPYEFTEFSDPNSPEIYSTAITRLFDDNGNAILTNDGESISADHIGIEITNSDGAPNPKTITRYYGVFAPQGTTFKKAGNKIKMQLGNGEGYLSMATMPSDSDLNYFYKHAYAFVTDTKVDYNYDDKTSDVTTDFKQITSLKRTDLADSTLMCMLPAQWKASSDSTTDLEYPSVRGALKVHEGNSFSTVDKFNGMVPQFTEPLNSEYSRSNLLKYLADLDKSTSSNYMSGDAYWQGKVLHPLAMGVIIADQINAKDYKEKFLKELKAILTDWYTYKPGETEGYYFNYNPEWGTLIYKNSEFGANTGITDHHFTYGYFTFASAILATYDSDFLKNYGPMVDTLIRDYANPSKTDSEFPQFRNFDPYEGHSWAGGYADNNDGNNQEAAGESLFGWVGEYMWGTVSGNTKYRDAGIYGFTTELKAVEQYWFNYDGDNWLPDYNHKTVGQVYGGANFFGTFFNGNSVYVYGIHWLPTGEYLTNYGVDKEKVANLYEGMKEDIINDYDKNTDPNKGPAPNPNDVETDWRHITWPIESLSDSKAVLDKWDVSKVQTNEAYDTYWFVNNMATLGQRTRDVWAENGVTSSIYKNGDKYTALAWNPTDSPLTVKFCDASGELGYTIVAPKALVAVDPLIKGAVSKNALQAEINATNTLIQTDYTEESWAALNLALTAATTVNNDVVATSEQVDTALKNLRDASATLIKTTGMPNADVNLALNKTAVSSSNEADGLGPQNTTDENTESRWGSNWAVNNDNHPEYVYVDLGQPYFIGDVKVFWSDAYSKEYKIQTCISKPEDESSWVTASTVTDSTGGLQDSTLASTSARYVRIYCINPATQWGASIKNIEVYGAKADKTALKAKIDQANQLKESDYTQDNWVNFKNALITSTKVNDDLNTTQDKVDEALKTLQDVINVLTNTGDNNNLALSKVAVSSSNEADGLGAQNTTDDNLDSRWSSNWAANTDNHPESVFVDLGDFHDINNVKLSWSDAYAKGYEIQTCISNPEDESSWSTVASISDGTGGLQESRFANTNARYVRIYCTNASTQWGYSIKNIEVYSYVNKIDLDNDENLALSKSAVSSSNEADGLGAQNTTDDNLDSRWSSNWAANTDNHPEYMYLDLGDVSNNISNVKILWDSAYARGYEIQACKANPDDESSWETVSTIKDGAGGLADIVFPSVSARYIRIYCKKPITQWGYSLRNIEIYTDKIALEDKITEGNSLEESNYTEDTWKHFSKALVSAIEVESNKSATTEEIDNALGDLNDGITNLVKDTESNDVNLALNKPAESSSNEAIGLDAQHTTDKDTDSRWSSNWAANKDNHPEYLYMDLGKSYNMNNVKVLWDSAYAKGYEIQTSTSDPEDESSWNTVASVTDGTGGLQNSTFASTNARYVRIYCEDPSTQWGYSIKNIEIYAGVDKNSLGSKIDAANELKESDYTEYSWESFSNALTAAIDVNNNEKTTQNKINKALKNLKGAIDTLEKATVKPKDSEDLPLDESQVSSSNEKDASEIQNTNDTNANQ